MKRSILAAGAVALLLASASGQADFAKSTCSLATLKGTLAWSGVTEHLNGTPTAGSGFEYYDGKGHMKYYEQWSDGKTSAVYSGTGTYTLGANCIATVVYDGVQIEVGYRIDMMVDEAVIVELKSVTKLSPVHEAQILSYLRLSGRRVGLLMNFHEHRLKDGIRRIMN